MAADGGRGTSSTRRRVFVEDARRNGQFLRVTWHGEQQQFVVSNWDDNLCVGATRVPVEGVPELVSLLVEGVAEAATSAPRPADRRSPSTLRQHVAAWWRERGGRAAVLPLAGTGHDRRRRSA